MPALVRYEQARTALAECARIDEASEIRDKASALAAYARQRDDRDLEVWVREIHLRACVRIGELSRELERADHGGSGGGSKFPAVGTSKAQALADAGISTSTAHRYEELAGGREEQAQAAGRAAMEAYFAQSRADGAPPTMTGLRGAVRDAVHATLGPPPPRTKRTSPPPEPPKVTPIGADWADWTAAVLTVATLPTDFASLAGRSPRALLADLRGEAREALQRLPLWINALENEHDHTA
ncbi:hypothetical protein [Sediminicoccus sp. KRV36]|uniref:hypothetical protein n=1 Tax=Sediminicoccus sp. KRV36 TaxID=3133721 RepID=UPI00200C7101|nr:hypothetical protein [Sediminicoccus rosea]UPY35046.1 hypothetical protein LHU95_12460 [Sediminicoccus rosea]